MPETVKKYVRKHRLTAAVVATVFAAGGVFAVARADIENLQKEVALAKEERSELQEESHMSHSKLDGIADDVRIIKMAIIGGAH